MRQALIVWGGWSGHEPEQCASIAAGMLRREGFEVVVEDTTEAFADPALGGFDLIVPVVTMATIEREELRTLMSAVEAGTGLAGFHGQMGDSFRAEPDYQFMVGGQWVAHPGNIVDYSVEIARPEDAVVRGIGDFAYRSEQYYMHVDPSNEVLATTRFTGEHCAWTRDVVMPVLWKRRHGGGRVFYSALGHVASEFSHPQMSEILRRGMLWAARD
jgi:type 1 glutamine amidotransferase